MNNVCKKCGKEAPKNKKYCSHECYLNRGKPIKICEGCGKEFNPSHKTTKYCSTQCFSSNRDYTDMRNKSKETMMEKYGVDHPAKMENHLDKVKQTLFNRYGVENASKIKDHVIKVKKTKLEKYGDENYVNIDKVKKTKLEKYGDENYVNTEKAKNTLLSKYGMKISPKSLNSTIERSRSGKIGFRSEKYKNYLKLNGIENVSQLESVKMRKSKNKLYEMFNLLINSDRLKNMVTPLFSINDYMGVEYKYKFRCNLCNDVFYSDIKNGIIPRCLKCYPMEAKNSKGQQELYYFIKSIYSGDILYNVSPISKTKLEFDIYIPDKKIAFEYNGLYWHSELNGKHKNYHLNKLKLAEDNGIRLIHIFEDEWINKNSIVKSKIENLFVYDYVKIYARKCNIKEITNSEKNIFLDNNHIQGKDNSSIKLGAYYNDELIAVMTFGKPRRSLGYHGGNFYELIRFATSKKVIGIGGKLLKYFIMHYNPNKIVTYADRCWSTELKDNLYIKLGFKRVSITKPNYWYVINNVKIHRFNFRKNVLNKKLKIFNSALTEWENMKLNGYDRVWDCGNYKYEMIIYN